ncbi:hypothetical protein ACIHDR_09635 [Nocardia sp. NPDC052278]|uniref:hypothetical protein n=1 Tax=unclassified Nocardia TaxID=2637762 RepID=UPI0036CAC228
MLISLVGCPTAPEIESGNTDDRKANRSSLSFSAGAHVCPDPDQKIATLIAHESVAQVVDALPDIGLPAEHLDWLPDSFRRALVALPVVFRPTPPLPVPS